MSDDLGLFADESTEPRRRGRQQTRAERERFRRRRRRRSVTALAGVLVLLIVGAGVLYGASQIFQIGTYEDYDGGGSGQAVIEVASGETISAIGGTLVEQDVVASVTAFTKAAESNNEISGIQPGYYVMKKQMSGKAAVERLVSPEAKTGRLEIRGGMRLEDQLAPDGGKTPGVLTKIAKASCSDPEGGEDCLTSEEVHQVAAEADLASLGVPEWAIGPASAAAPNRRLEGLIMPGLYDVKPGQSAQEVLTEIVTSSAAKLQAAGLPQAAENTGKTPYEVLTIASLIQSEGITKDFGKVSRVIYNRLDQSVMRLGLDSTINYPSDKPALLTDPSDREREGPYNTYRNYGLPPTPISAPSKEAVNAAEKPTEGSWLYFVRCYKDGTSCFSDTHEQHLIYRDEAQERGAY
ncbi:endolytic transglycosylase MltG [Parasphingorhabdus pacifica]